MMCVCVLFTFELYRSLDSTHNPCLTPSISTPQGCPVHTHTHSHTSLRSYAFLGASAISSFQPAIFWKSLKPAQLLHLRAVEPHNRDALILRHARLRLLHFGKAADDDLHAAAARLLGAVQRLAPVEQPDGIGGLRVAPH